MRYFGEKWDATWLDDVAQIATPVGLTCIWCQEAIVEGDQGWVHGLPGDEDPALYTVEGWAFTLVHRECGVRQAVGGANHILGLCTCCGGNRDPDPPDLSTREAAKLAVKLFESRPHG